MNPMHTSILVFNCVYCTKSLPTKAGLHQHLAKAQECQKRLRLAIEARLRQRVLSRSAAKEREGDVTSLPLEPEEDLGNGPGPHDFEHHSSRAGDHDTPIFNHLPELVDGENPVANIDQDGSIEVELYPGEAGLPIDAVDVMHHEWKRSQEAHARTLRDSGWRTAHWLMTTGLSSSARDEYLKIPENLERLPWKNDRVFIEAIDSLPHGPEWNRTELTLTGDAGEEIVELWYRESLECIRNLIGNPKFKEYTHYKPERHWKTSGEGTSQTRVYGEMWSGDWWWRMQDELSTRDSKATIVPYILSSDKTQLSVFSGDKKAWPVYLTLGNISKSIRRQPSKQATILIAYLPVAKLDCFSSIDNRRTQHQELFHYSMTTVLRSIINLGKDGTRMICGDGNIRQIFPILTSYVADWPEQCLVAGCLESRCPTCKARTNERGDFGERKPPIQSKKETLAAIQLKKRTGYSKRYIELGLRPSISFWAHLEYVNMFTCFTPDALHQLHKGVFGDHLVKWITRLMGEKELDRRYKVMPHQHGLRHFKNGISQVSQWTGREHKNMQKVFIAAIAGLQESQAVKAARAVMDFIYISQFSEASEDELDAMDEALTLFHELKNVFTDTGVCPDGFNGIPKVHMLSHYTFLIRELGATNGYSTEFTERLHIDYAKLGYRASNKVNATKQMAIYLQRQEAVKQHTSYLSWRLEQDTRLQHVEHEQDDEEQGIDVEMVDVEEPGVQVDVSRRESQYPCPMITCAKRANVTQATASWIMVHHKAANFIEAINTFLMKTFPKYKPSVSGEDRFDLWTRVKLHHASPRFSGIREAQVIEVIRAFGATLGGQHRCIVKAGMFDTVLLVDKPEETGYHRYRVARIRAIFQLPRRLLGGYSGRLVYLEYFTRFGSYPHSVSGLFPLSHSKRNGKREVVVRPIEEIVMACQLAPNWRHEATVSALAGNPTTLDLLDSASSFQFNTFASPLMYAYDRQWKSCD